MIRLLQVVRGDIRLADGVEHESGRVNLHWVGTKHPVGYESLAEAKAEVQRVARDVEFISFAPPADWLRPPDPRGRPSWLLPGY